MNFTTHPFRAAKLTALLGAFAVAMLGSVAVASPASALTPYDMPAGPGSLTIHKFAQPAPVGAANHDGTVIDTAGLVALQDVQFSAQRITDIDLTTDGGWDLASEYAAAPETIDAANLAAGTAFLTGATGASATTPLANGAYLVTETDASNAKLPDGSPANVVMTSAPFVVTVPIPLGEGLWNSQVNVYPKNSITPASKTVSAPTGSGLGETVTWTIHTQVPALAAGQSFSEFHIVDELDNRLEYAGPARLTLNGVAIGFAAESGIAGQDTNTRGGTLTVTLDDASIALLAGAANQTLSLSFDTIVRGTGNIPNEATVHVNTPSTEVGFSTNEVHTHWGAVTLTKHVTGDTTALLEGAVFRIYASEADAIQDENAIVAGGLTDFRTGDNGTVSIPGLWAGETATSSTTYWLKEITAPAGYVLNETPQAVVVTADSLTEAVSVLVPNTQKPELSLPLTGGAGTSGMLIGGAVVILAAGGVALYAARRNRRTTSSTD